MDWLMANQLSKDKKVAWIPEKIVLLLFKGQLFDIFKGV